jgi:hypothetical protein
MWSITPEGVDRVKEELKGRHAAIQARYEDEIQKLTAEIDDIEAFERVATAFAQRHNRKEASAPVEPDPIAPLEARPIAPDLAVEAEGAGDLDLHLENHGEMEILPAPEVLPFTADASVGQKVSARWRVRV